MFRAWYSVRISTATSEVGEPHLFGLLQRLGLQHLHIVQMLLCFQLCYVHKSSLWFGLFQQVVQKVLITLFPISVQCQLLSLWSQSDRHMQFKKKLLKRPGRLR